MILGCLLWIVFVQNKFTVKSVLKTEGKSNEVKKLIHAEKTTYWKLKIFCHIHKN